MEGLQAGSWDAHTCAFKKIIMAHDQGMIIQRVL
jgi:hypothetical protein